MFKKKIYVVYFTVFILLLLIIFYNKKTTEYLTTPPSCTALNQDPYGQPGHIGSYVNCCSGSKMDKKNWDNDGRYYFKCISTQPPVTNCTKEGGNSWSNDNVHTPCCSGLTEIVDPLTGYLICKSISLLPDYPGLQCIKEGGSVVKDNFTKCCQGLVQDTSRPGWITCKSPPQPGPQYGKKVLIVVRHGDKNDSIAWTSVSRPNCVNCKYVTTNGCNVKKNRSCEYLTTTLPNGKVVNYHNVTLVDSGINEGDAFATVIPDLVNNLGVAKITKAIIFDPRPVDSAANSFQTILPFLIKNNINKVDFFIDPNVFNSISQTLENNDGSIIVAANHEVLWEANTSAVDAPHPINGSILNILGKIYNINNNNIPNPVRGKTIYVFSNPNKMDVYSMDANSKTYNEGYLP